MGKFFDFSSCCSSCGCGYADTQVEFDVWLCLPCVDAVA